MKRRKVQAGQVWECMDLLVLTLMTPNCSDWRCLILDDGGTFYRVGSIQMFPLAWGINWSLWNGSDP